MKLYTHIHIQQAIRYIENFPLLYINVCTCIKNKHICTWAHTHRQLDMTCVCMQVYRLMANNLPNIDTFKWLSKQEKRINIQ